jgi:excisionase family DNA binding protein
MGDSHEGVRDALSGADELKLFTDPRSRLLSKREIAEFLGKSENSVDRLRRQRKIPFLIVGGSIRFRLVDVERALGRYQVKEVAL